MERRKGLLSATGRGVLLLLPVVVALLLRGPALAAPRLMSDAEMDEVSAGDLNFSLNAGDSPSFNFSFDQGTTAGYGSVTTTPAAWTPSTLTMTGAVDLSHTLINVENMIFNLNICVQCSGTILQSGIGVPITIKAAP